jgi:hypothetical protein
MNKQPQLPDERILVDWLAKETQLYTKALIDGATEETLIRHRVIIDALITEIRRRRKEDLPAPRVLSNLPPNDFFEAVP